jgi:hypothetical protein
MREFCTTIFTIIAAGLCVCPAVLARDGTPPSTANKPCPTIFSAPKGYWTERLTKCALPDETTLRINATTAISPFIPPTEVPNNSTAHVIINKRPIDDCKLKASSDKYESGSTLGALAQLLASLSHFGYAANYEVTLEVYEPNGAPETVKDNFAVLDDALVDAKVYTDAYQTTEDDVKKFVDCVNGANCSDATSILSGENARQLLSEINAVLYPALLPPDARNLNRMADDIDTLLASFQQNAAWLPAAKKHLNADRISIQQIAAGDSYRLRLRDEFGKLAVDLATYKTLSTLDVTLPNQKSAKFVGTIVCTNHFTHEQFGSDLPFTVLYYNPAPVTASAGVLISPLSKRPIGVLSQSTPCNGTTTIMNCYAVTTTSDAQFVPMGLGNLYLSGSTKLNLNFSGGIGVNLNNGSAQMEYFLGPSVGIHGFYLSPGLDFISFPSLKDGLQLGDPAPTGSNASNPPLVYHHTVHFAFTISYRLTRGK